MTDDLGLKIEGSIEDFQIWCSYHDVTVILELHSEQMLDYLEATFDSIFGIESLYNGEQVVVYALPSVVLEDKTLYASYIIPIVDGFPISQGVFKITFTYNTDGGYVTY